MENKSEIVSIILKELNDYRSEIKTIQEEQIKLSERTNTILGHLRDKKLVLDELLSVNSTTQH